jgi:hypothetical protein
VAAAALLLSAAQAALETTTMKTTGTNLRHTVKFSIARSF